MKRILLFLSLACLFCGELSAQSSMTDTQVMQFIQREMKAGTSQSQIAVKLVQRGVKMDQIRRVRSQYEEQIQKRGLGAAANAAMDDFDDRTRSATGDDYQEVTTAKVGTATEIDDHASDVQQRVEADIQAASAVSQETVGKKIFGHDIFNRQLLSFEPNMNIATPSNYVLGPGDVAIVDIYGASQKTMSLTVSPEGTITVPGYGPIQVSGMTVEAANAKIRSQLGTRYSSSNIKMSVGKTRTILVNVMGAVKAPGTYHLSSFATVFHALYMAGGITDLGTLRNIKVSRHGRIITVVDVYEFILNGRLAGNVMLQDDDVIQVGTYDCIVGVAGNVKRPMFYEMRKNETVATLIKYAGGYTGDAYTKSVRLQRSTGERRSVHNIDEFDMADFKVADGDNVTVDGIIDRYENMVEVKGAVFRPGQFNLGEKVFSVRSLIQHAEGLTEDAFADHAVLHRRKADRSLEVISVDVAGILSESVPDIPLRNEDVLFIPTKGDLISERTLTINGEVMSPGVYEYADNTTLEDLVMQAGGLRDAASTVRVDVSRRIVDPTAMEAPDEIAKTFSFSLKEGFVVDGQPGFVLQPYDVVYVRRSPAFHIPRNISVEGEVNFAGGHTLSRKNQRLSDAIAAAGGVTKQAYVPGARLIRQMDDDERARVQKFVQMARANVTEGDSIDLNKLYTAQSYSVGIELDKALANPGGDYDLVLREGDRIVVPEYNGTVKVSGTVMFPNTVSYSEGKNYKWYVNQAGGFGHRAKKSKTYIVYSNGTVAQVGHGATVKPGCEIYVPSKRKRNSSLGQILSVGSTLTSIAAMVAMVINLTK